MSPQLSRTVRCVCLLFLLVAPSGCTAIGELNSLVIGEPALGAIDQQPIPPNIPSVTVVMIEEGNEPVAAPLPLTETTYVQMALERTGLSQRFARMNIELFRPLDSGTHRLEVEFDRAEQRVLPRYDYALRPGDRLVVTEDTSTVVDDMLDSLNFLK